MEAAAAQTAGDFFEPFEQVQPNAIQIAQNAFLKDERSTDPSLPANQRKHGLAQGFLLTNKVYEGMVDPQGDPINQKPGPLYLMGAIQEAESRRLERRKENPDLRRYQSPGEKLLLEIEALAKEVIFGNKDPEALKKILTVPTMGMALSFAQVFQLLQKGHPDLKTVVLGTNGYGGYKSVLDENFETTIKYRQGTENNEFDMDSFRETIEGLKDPKNTLLLLQADAYNYTGVNPTSEQKQEIVEILKKHGVVTLVDSAYQGLIRNLDDDVEIARLLAESGLPFVVYDSYSKKAGIYGDRVSFVHFATGSEEQAKILKSNVYKQLRDKALAVPRTFELVYDLLTDETLKQKWIEELETAQQILYTTKVKMAEALGEGFEYIHPDHTQGMFNKFNISHEGGQVLADKYGIFVVNQKDEDTGEQSLRVNMGAIPEQDIEYIAASIKEVYNEYRTD
jgi:aromatic-amino-acid transaminase